MRRAWEHHRGCSECLWARNVSRNGSEPEALKWYSTIRSRHRRRCRGLEPRNEFSGRMPLPRYSSVRCLTMSQNVPLCESSASVTFVSNPSIRV